MDKKSSTKSTWIKVSSWKLIDLSKITCVTKENNGIRFMADCGTQFLVEFDTDVVLNTTFLFIISRISKRMNDLCSNCGFLFFESTTQYAKRVRHGFDTPKVCSQCRRLDNAEENAAKRLVKKEKAKKTKDEEDYFRSPCYLQRKFKFTYAKAKELSDKYIQTNDISLFDEYLTK